MVRWRGPWRSGSYRVVVETKRDRSISTEISAILFDVPLPSLVLTGDAVWNDRAGDAHFVRHACVADSRSDAAAMSTAIMHKVLILEYERPRRYGELYEWLRRHGGTEVARSLSTSSARRHELLAPGASVLIGYESRGSRTRVVWPDENALDFHGDDVMRGLWGFYFDSPQQLKHQLVRWQ